LIGVLSDSAIILCTFLQDKVHLEIWTVDGVIMKNNACLWGAWLLHRNSQSGGVTNTWKWPIHASGSMTNTHAWGKMHSMHKFWSHLTMHRTVGLTD